MPGLSRKAKAASEERIARLRHTAEARATRLEEGRRTGLFVAVGKRFVEIDGGTYGGLMAIELFTTVLPLMIIGFGYFSGFAANASIGTMFVRQLGLTGTTSQSVRAAFGSSEALQSSWTIAGLAGWIIWGIPMAITVAGMFAKAWHRVPFSFFERFWRGTAWFLLYLTHLIIRERISFGVTEDDGPRVALFLVSLVPAWLFWTFTPVVLVRDGGRGWRFLAKAGLAGVVIDGVIMAVGLRLFFPSLLSGWTIFGPIGVAMAIMTWCGFVGYGWVSVACFSGVLWERSAPIPTVVAAESGT
jgi:hypothetical protein